MDRLTSEEVEAWRPYRYQFDPEPIDNDIVGMYRTSSHWYDPNETRVLKTSAFIADTRLLSQLRYQSTDIGFRCGPAENS